MSGMRDHAFGCSCRQHADRPWNRSEHWTKAEVAYLEAAYGRVTMATIAKRLGRSKLGIRLKAKRLGLRMKDAGYTASELARLMGVDPSTVMKSWIKRGGLKARRPYRVGPNAVYISTEASMEAFIRDRGWWIDWAKVPADSPFHALVMANRWFGKADLHRLTGRLDVDDEIRAGRIYAERRGAHWYVPEREVAKIRTLPPEHIAESVWRRENVLRVRRERRRRLAGAGMSEIGLMSPPGVDHDRRPVPGSRVGDHGICQCGRIVELSPNPGARLTRKKVGSHWRHHPNPTSTMIPAAVREAAP